jgi:ParB-like chromosome segregation protein Spo0J
MKLVELDPRTLKPNPENYRGHPQEQIAEIATSLRDLGQFKNVVVRPDGTILAGHGVVQAAIAEGVPVVWGFIFEGTDAEARRLMVADNELSRGADTRGTRHRDGPTEAAHRACRCAERCA